MTQYFLCVNPRTKRCRARPFRAQAPESSAGSLPRGALGGPYTTQLQDPDRCRRGGDEAIKQLLTDAAGRRGYFTASAPRVKAAAWTQGQELPSGTAAHMAGSEETGGKHGLLCSAAPCSAAADSVAAFQSPRESGARHCLLPGGCRQQAWAVKRKSSECRSLSLPPPGCSC